MTSNVELCEGMFTCLGSNFRVVSCGSCGVVYGMPTGYFDNRQKDHKEWRCPNIQCNSTWVFADESDEERLKRELKSEKEKTRHERIRFEREKIEREMAERSARAYKGKLKRIKTRIGNGVCPYCNRSFKDVRRHMAHQHKDCVAKTT